MLKTPKKSHFYIIIGKLNTLEIRSYRYDNPFSFSLFKQIMQILLQNNVKMSKKYPMPGFELMTFRL